MTLKEEFDAILTKMKGYFLDEMIELRQYYFNKMYEREGRIQELEKIVYFAGLRKIDAVAADIVDSMLVEIGEAPAHAEGEARGGTEAKAEEREGPSPTEGGNGQHGVS